MPILTQYSIVCQVPGAEPYTICAYNGADLNQVLGITQASLHEGNYGWIQECGEAFVSVRGQTQAVYVDFRPNAAKRHLREELSEGSQEQVAELQSGAMGENTLAHNTLERLSQLPPLLIEDGPYCGLIREARDVFADGHFYACVAMCVLCGNTKCGKSETYCKRKSLSHQKHSVYARKWQTCGTITHMDMG